MHVNIIGNSRRKQLKMERGIKNVENSLWGEIPCLHNFSTPIWKYWIRKFAIWFYKKTEKFIKIEE